MRIKLNLLPLIVLGLALLVPVSGSSQEVAKRATKRAAKEATESAAKQAAEDATKKAVKEGGRTRRSRSQHCVGGATEEARAR